MSNEEFSCMELLKRISDTLKKNANNGLKARGITFSQLQMLLALNEIPKGSATLKELEKYFSVAQSTAAGIAVRLENKKLVTGVVDADDKRIKHIQLTDAGKEVCLNTEKEVREMEQRLISRLTEDEEELLRGLLRKVYETIE